MDNDIVYKSYLNDEEFIEWKTRFENILLLNQLRYDKNKQIVSERQIIDSKMLGTLCMDEFIPGEIWKTYPYNKDYSISSFGRVKYKERIIPQKDEEGKIGWLKLDGTNFDNKLLHYYTYQLTAWTFLIRPDTGEYHIHHITNNGYDNSIGNLIYLSKTQHEEIHRIENKYKKL